MMEVGIDIKRQIVLDVEYVSNIIYNYIKYFILVIKKSDYSIQAYIRVGYYFVKSCSASSRGNTV